MRVVAAAAEGAAGTAGRARFALRPLGAEEVLYLLENEETLSAAEKTTELLARCATRAGDAEPLTRDAARQLSVGAREALLLHLQRATFGERIACVIPCPHCSELMDLDLRVGDLLVAGRDEQASRYECTLPDSDGGDVVVRFRLPDGAAQEDAAPLAAVDPDAAGARILAHCVEEPAVVPPELRQPLAEIFAELDPQSEITLSLDCPACGAAFVSLFDAATFLFREAIAQAHELLREVHLLAFFYHWSEREIVAMSARKRRTYVALIEAQSKAGRR